MGRPRILILGGTSDAGTLAQALADTGRFEILLSLAGRTDKPASQPVPFRVGGFGGVEGLVAFLRQGEFNLVIDATHPFAARISRNASAACATGVVPALALRRPEWVESPEDRWAHVEAVPQAIAAIGPCPRRVFLSIGRQEAHRAEVAPQHFYLVRSVDPVEPPLVLPNVELVLDRGPYVVEREIALLRNHRIDTLVTKNSGGSATYAKIEAARNLGIRVIMVARAPAAGMQTVATIEAMLAAIDQFFPPAMKRGV